MSHSTKLSNLRKGLWEPPICSPSGQKYGKRGLVIGLWKGSCLVGLRCVTYEVCANCRWLMPELKEIIGHPVCVHRELENWNVGKPHTFGVRSVMSESKLQAMNPKRLIPDHALLTAMFLGFYPHILPLKTGAQRRQVTFPRSHSERPLWQHWRPA